MKVSFDKRVCLHGKLTCNPECFIPAISEGNVSVSVGIIQVLVKVKGDSKQF